MKHGIRVIIMSLCALTASVGALRAEEHVLGPKESSVRGARMQDRLREVLGLSDEQAVKVKGVFDGERKTAAPLHDALKVSLEKLRWQVDAKADVKDITATLDQVDKNRKALDDARGKAAASLAGILTPEQRARMVLDWHDGEHGARGSLGMPGDPHRSAFGDDPGGRHGMIPHKIGGPGHKSRGRHERAGGPPPEDEGPPGREDHSEE